MKLQSLNINQIAVMMLMLGSGGTAGAFLSNDQSMSTVASELKTLNDRVLVIETRLKIEGEYYEACNSISASR